MGDLWKTKLRVDLLPWLLELNNTSVRYFTFNELLQLSESDTDILETKELIMSHGIIPRILKKQIRPFQEPFRLLRHRSSYGSHLHHYFWLFQKENYW